MNDDSVFLLCNAVATSAWALLLFAPRWEPTTRLIGAVIIPGLLGIAYVFALASGLGQASGGFASLAELAELFQSRRVLLAGWIHYLAFDLFVGAWQTREAGRLALPHWLLVPCLLLTLLAGPAGLLTFLAARYFATGQVHIER